MRILLLHPNDVVDRTSQRGRWDLIVDLGRAPVAAYETWSRETGSPVLALAEFSKGMADVRSLRDVFQNSADQMVDEVGIDWWELLKLNLVAEFLQISLLRRFAGRIERRDEVWISRHDYRGAALGVFTGREVRVIEHTVSPIAATLRKCRDFLLDLDGTQMGQVVRDKFDPHHELRRRFAKTDAIREDCFLLPSAYIGVSRSAADYAKQNPQQRFVMMYARKSAELPDLPPNVSAGLLDGYFSLQEPKALAGLLKAWGALRARSAATVAEFDAANRAGVLDKIPPMLAWGLSVRNAWMEVFKTNRISGCFCADDSNLYTRVPLMLAHKAGVPTVTRHHGAMDFVMAVKRVYGGYEAKTELERDYLLRQCSVPAKAVSLQPSGAQLAPEFPMNSAAGYLTFFTEPYGAESWRTDEVYSEMLPQLMAMTRGAGWRLAFKVHPFESAKGHRRLLRRHLRPDSAARIDVFDGAMPESLWAETRVAITVESSMAMECARRGVPIFLCGWLRSPFCEYQTQFARFGMGQVLEKVGDIACVPKLLAQFQYNAQRREDVLPSQATGQGDPHGMAALFGK